MKIPLILPMYWATRSARADSIRIPKYSEYNDKNNTAYVKRELATLFTYNEMKITDPLTKISNTNAFVYIQCSILKIRISFQNIVHECVSIPRDTNGIAQIINEPKL